LPDADSSVARPALVENDESLRAFCASLKGASYLALDTEFVRVRTYYPELCLIQVAAPQRLACIDPLAWERLPVAIPPPVSLAPLLDILHDPSIVKIMHAGRQDLELFYLLDGRLPAPLFDTQIAAAMLGFDDQVGYAKLVESLLGITLEKAHTRTDWAERPLSAEQLSYAAEDVQHLVTLYERLRERLAERGRLAWLEEDAQALLDPTLYRVVPEDMWRRVKGCANLRNPAERAALEKLAAWREREAMSRNRPRQWVLRDPLLLAIARAMPASRQRLSQIPELPRPVVDRYAANLLELIDSARGATGPGHPSLERTDTEHADRLVAAVRKCAASNDLSPSLIAPRRELTQLLRGDRDLALLRGWRLDLIGRELLALADELSGRVEPRG
jgi:ribonuclease D